MNNQPYIFGEQLFRISRCENKVDVIVTDSPLLLSIFYNKNKIIENSFNMLVVDIFKSYNSLNYMLLRDKPYNSIGRLHTKEESDSFVDQIKKLLTDNNIEFNVCRGNQREYNNILNDIISALRK